MDADASSDEVTCDCNPALQSGGGGQARESTAVEPSLRSALHTWRRAAPARRLVPDR